MRIQSLSKVLVLPLLMLLGLVYYLSEYVDGDYSIAYVVVAIIGVVIYISHGNIDFWYLKKYPAGLDSRLQQWLKHDFVLYNRLRKSQQLEFEYRMELYLNARLFIAKGSEDREVPEDIKALIAGYGLYLGIQFPDILIGDFDRIFLYGHPFPTPSHPELHSVEVDTEDGVIVLDTSLAINAHLHPDKYYNIIIHAYTQVFEFLLGPLPKALTPDRLEEVIPWTFSGIETQIGSKDLSAKYVHVHHYIVFPEGYRRVFPEQALLLDNYFNVVEN